MFIHPHTPNFQHLLRSHKSTSNLSPTIGDSSCSVIASLFVILSTSSTTMADTIITSEAPSMLSQLNPPTSDFAWLIAEVKKQLSHYTCSRCKTRYCSLPCYKDAGLECTIVRPFNWIGTGMVFFLVIDGPVKVLQGKSY